MVYQNFLLKLGFFLVDVDKVVHKELIDIEVLLPCALGSVIRGKLTEFTLPQWAMRKHSPSVLLSSITLALHVLTYRLGLDLRASRPRLHLRDAGLGRLGTRPLATARPADLGVLLPDSVHLLLLLPCQLPLFFVA